MATEKVPKVGDTISEVKLALNTPDNLVSIRELSKGKRFVLCGVPGAFTPTCHKTHLPGYVADFDKFKALGVDQMAFLSVNDVFVMNAWGESLHAGGKVLMLADVLGEFTASLGEDMLFYAAVLGQAKRARRFSMIIDDGVIKVFNLEPVGQTECSLAPNLLKQLAALGPRA